MVYNVRLVILDYDLTLINNVVDFYISFVEALRELTGKIISYDTFIKLLVEDRLSEAIPENINQWTFWRNMRRKICRSRALIPNKGIDYFLQTLNSFNVKTVIVSGKECYPTHIVLELEKIGLMRYVSDVYTFFNLYLLGGREDSLFDKSWLLKYVVSRYKVEAFETVYIGDYKVDYYSSLKAGINFIGYVSLPSRMKMFRELGVKYIVRDFYEALNILSEINKNI